MLHRVSEIRFMTFRAGYILVFAFQFEAGFGMIEVRNSFYGVKVPGRMTLDAILAERRSQIAIHLEHQAGGA